MSTLLGKKLLNYRIEKLLGQGGMGEVYLGVHTEIGRKVAIKVISPHLARDPKIQERFKREALILAKLNHPNIVQLYDYWARPEEGLFLIMEYVEGISLDRYIHRVLRGPIPPHQAIDLFLQVLDAFQYAHDNGVIHRDIKPSNILIRNDNVVKVLDFGIARIVTPDPTTASEAITLTQTGTTLGTVLYMSPEQLKSKNPSDIDHRADIYSLGVVLFEMLTGKEMYDRGQLSEFEILIKIASEPPPTLSDLAPAIATDFEPILIKALAKKREERYQSCQEFAADLLKVLPKYADKAPSPNSYNPALTQTQIGTPSPESFLHRTYAQIKASWQKAQTLPPQKKIFLGFILVLLAGGIGSLLWLAFHSNAEKRHILSQTETFAKAIHSHDEHKLRALFSETLSPFFSDAQISQEGAITKYYTSFWQTLQEDSVAWIEEPSSYKKGNTWQVEGLLYQKYTTKPQTFTRTVDERVYDRWYGRYIKRPRKVIDKVPATTSCKIKKLRLYFIEGKITGIEVLDTRECP
jgi:serine/threonine protein kinase